MYVCMSTGVANGARVRSGERSRVCDRRQNLCFINARFAYALHMHAPRVLTREQPRQGCADVRQRRLFDI